MNITLIVLGGITFFLCMYCFRKGMTKVFTGLIMWIVSLLVVALLVIIYMSIKLGEIKLSAAAIAALILLAVIYGIVRIVTNLIRMIARLPIIHFLDRVLGLAVGVAEGTALAWIVFIVSESGILGSLGEIISHDIAKSRILSSLYNYNYLLKLIQMIRVL